MVSASKARAGSVWQGADLGERRLYRKVATLIEARIKSGEFVDGSKLPTERDLSASFGVSRAIIREALIALEIAGLVRIRMGSGVFVTSPKVIEEDLDLTPIDEVGPFELTDARLNIEPEVAANAATRRTPEHIRQLEAAIEVMIEEHRTNAPHEKGDRQFHLILAEASGNTIVTHLVAELWKLNQNTLWEIFLEWVRQPRLRLVWIEDHRRIVDAVRRGDRRKARAEMRRHLQNIQEALKSVPIGTD